MIVSYISIGEAENYRYYWNDKWDINNDGIPDESAPGWLDIENPNWEGNYKVRYWNSDWQNIIFEYIDKIIAQGFNGIYCDIIDAYYYWSEEIDEEPRADSLMVEFLYKIKAHINTQTNEPFFILPQNGEYIIEEANITADLRTKYFSSIDAIGVEDVFHPGDLDENNPFDPDEDRIRVLRDYVAEDKKVLSVEYLTESGLINSYMDAALDKNFIPYTSVRALDVLNDGVTSVARNHEMINKYILYQNYPNPFNPATTIAYSIPSSLVPTHVSLIVYNALGQRVATLVKEQKAPGMYKVNFDAANLSSGVYFYKLQTDKGFSSIKKLVLLK